MNCAICFSTFHLTCVSLTQAQANELLALPQCLRAVAVRDAIGDPDGAVDDDTPPDDLAVALADLRSTKSAPTHPAEP